MNTNIWTLQQPVFLCGFMGCGKTTAGRLFAKQIGCVFYDLDDYIEQTLGMKIPEIFNRHGEDYFRRAETDALKHFISKPAVVATGGGALVSEENGALALEYAVSVLIDTDFDTCYARIQGDKYRPLAANATREELLARYESRLPFYKKHSALTVNGNVTPREIAEQLADTVNRFLYSSDKRSLAK